MPVENLIGSKYVDSLNAEWPLDGDSSAQGAPHLRGVKNTLKNTFPNLTGAVTRNQANLNTGAVPVDAVMVFYQAAAPLGWTRVSVGTTYGLRVVDSSTPGGVGGGSHDPVVMDKVPSHTHAVNGATGNANANHTHTFNVNTGGESADHAHYVTGNTGGRSAAHNHGGVLRAGGWTGAVAAAHPDRALGTPSVTDAESQEHVHSFSAWTGGRNAGHTHNVSGTTSGYSATHAHAVNITSAANAGAANWLPRYMDVILCKRVAL
jgi:hypothetical protein